MRERTSTFEEYLERSESYVEAIRTAGDVPWFAAGHPRRSEVVARLGLPENISEIDLRRALWARRNQATA